MIHSPDFAVVLAVLALRLVVPLFIPRFPLPGVIAAFLLDAADQTIFQTRTHLNLDWYQAYDKALDIYYLTIAYCSTMRNWTNRFAFRVSCFLFYFRLVGVLLFELTQERMLLLVFPNTFEYFFIWYEVVRLRGDPRRLSKRVVLGVGAGIWVLIKLPQEYWLHVAKLDVTEFLKQNVFGVPTDAAWGAIVAANPLPAAVVGLILLLLVAGVWLLLRRLPPTDPSLHGAPTCRGGRGYRRKRIV